MACSAFIRMLQSWGWSRGQGHGCPWSPPRPAASAQPRPCAAAPQDDEHPGTEPALRIKAAFAAGTFVLGLLTVAAPVAIIPTCQHQTTPDFALFRPMVRARPPAHARAHAPAPGARRRLRSASRTQRASRQPPAAASCLGRLGRLESMRRGAESDLASAVGPDGRPLLSMLLPYSIYQGAGQGAGHAAAGARHALQSTGRHAGGGCWPGARQVTGTGQAAASRMATVARQAAQSRPPAPHARPGRRPHLQRGEHAQQEAVHGQLLHAAGRHGVRALPLARALRQVQEGVQVERDQAARALRAPRT
jgi:hypothetical protein